MKSTRKRLIAAAVAFTAVLGFGATESHALQVGSFAPVVFNSGVPNSEVTVNLTVDNPQAAGFLTAYPCANGAPNPLTSNVNFRAGQTTSTAGIVKSDSSGNVCVISNVQTDIIVDKFDVRPLTDSQSRNISFGVHNGLRMVDTRNTGRVAGSSVFSYHAGAPGSTVLMNLTAVNPDTPGYLTAWPCDQPMPVASNVNYVAGDIVPNFVQTLADGSGNVCVFSTATTDLVIDQVAESSNAFMTTHNPVRKVDTRTNGTQLSPGVPMAVSVTPGPATVSFNLTAVNPTVAGYLTAYSCDAARPATSNVNFVAGETRANFARVRTNGQLCIVSNTTVDVVLDQVAEDTSVYASNGGRVYDSRTIPTPAPVPAPPAPTSPAAGASCLGGYINVDGNCIPSPTSAPSAPAGATAQCRDGTYSFSQHRQGTCSYHGGVARWL